ncbi:hypothetical protein RB597_007634 [Gaeumannomyces tritici]
METVPESGAPATTEAVMADIVKTEAYPEIPGAPAVPAVSEGGEDSGTASSITVNTKTAPPANNFPPPKTDKPRPHVCGTCQRSFARLEHLKRHERSHTKEKPFQCPECTRCFARRDLLLRHQQKLHQTTTPSSRPRNRRESASGAVPPGSRARKNSIASSTVSGVGGGPTTMRPRANTISHVDGAHISMMAAATANVARMNSGHPHGHSRHPSLVGLPMQQHIEHSYAGMAAAMGQRGMAHGLPKLETHAIGSFDPFANGLRTAPPIAAYTNEFDFEGLLFGSGSTINPNALHYSDSPHSMAIDPTSPFAHGGMADMASAHQMDETFDWLTGFEHQMSFNNAPEHAVDGSSPSAISTASQSGISDVMLDGSSNHPAVTTVAPSTTFFQPTAIMGPPQMAHPFGIDMTGGFFPDLLNGTPLSPQPPHQKGMIEPYLSTPPPSLNSISPSVLSGMGGPNMNHAAMGGYGAGPETPSSINGSNNHGTSPIATITDSTRHAILGALSCGTSQHSLLTGRRFSPGAAATQLQDGSASTAAAVDKQLPRTQDMQRYVAAYLRYFHPHLPFLHVPTLSFELPANLVGGLGGGAVPGAGCLILSMAAIGALYEMECEQSAHLFEMAKKMIGLYLEEKRKATVGLASFRRASTADTRAPPADGRGETPLWLAQAMLLNNIYGHNCADKRAAEIAHTHSATLVSLASGAQLLRPVRVEPRQRSGDEGMDGIEGPWRGEGQQQQQQQRQQQQASEAEQQAEWLRWKEMEERKRTLYVIFILSSMVVSAYNHMPALTNSEIGLDLPCDEEFFAAENAAEFNAKGGVAAANHNRMTFHQALRDLLCAGERQQQPAPAGPSSSTSTSSSGAHQPFGSSINPADLPSSDLKPSTFGCLVLINALHNYIWETRQRHRNRTWTNEETELMHRRIEPALRAWQAAWASNPRHSLERPNPFGLGPLSADSIPLLDLAYVRLFVNMSVTKEKFWQRDWDGLARELSRGEEIVQHAQHSPTQSTITDRSETSGAGSSVFIDSPPTQSSSPDFGAVKTPSATGPGQPQPQAAQTHSTTGSMSSASASGLAAAGRATSRREKHLRRAAFFAADSLAMSDRLGVTFADFSRELPLQSAMCAFDCSQVLAEWVATLQDRVGRYLGVLGKDEVELGQVPAIMLLEEEDVKLLVKVQDVVDSAEIKITLDGGTLAAEQGGYAAKILRVAAHMLGRSGAWPITRLMGSCLEQHANHMRRRAEMSVVASD